MTYTEEGQAPSGPRMVRVDLPSGIIYKLFNLILDLNGTLTIDGRLVDGVVERLKKLSERINTYVLTADTNQTINELKDQLVRECGVNIHILEVGRGDLQKLAFLENLGSDETAAIGNGYNDALMLREARLGLCVIGQEGAATEALMAGKAVFPNICDALDFLLKPQRMIATLRK